MELEYFRRLDTLTSKLRSTYARIRLSRLFSAYVVLTLVFCLLQVTMHFLVFLNDRAASSRFSSITAQAKIPRRFADQLPNNTIVICDDIRGNQNCKVAGNTFEAVVSAIGTESSTSSDVMIAILPSTGFSAPSLPTPTARALSNTMTTTVLSTGLRGSSFPAPMATKILPSPAATKPLIDLSGSSPTGTFRRPHGPHYRRPHYRESVQPSFRFSRRHAFASGLRSVHDFAQASIFHNRRSLNIQPQINSSGAIDGVTLTGLNGQSQPVTLSMGCIESLAFPDVLFREARREDLTMISFSFWVLVMSVASIIYDSIPHLVVAFLGNCASLGWSVGQVTLTARFSEVIYNAITVNAYGGIELRPTGALGRNEQMLVSAILNACFFPVFAFLSYKIFRIYRHQSFQRVGATNKVYNIYTLALVFSVCLHLSGFLLISASVLWLNEVLTGVIRKYFHSKALVIALFIWGIVGNVPWLVMGSNIILHERKRLMLAFLVHCLAVSVLWAVTMTTRLFQYTIWTWPFFASLSILSYIFLVATTALGIVCRWNFGNGLKHYITVLEVLEKPGLHLAFSRMTLRSRM
ncbi:hypothetical protein BD410DRAFT_486553 [Rickenella mellea]|uniref:Uncharacterized protein n=1 Tax=Rickenella mellea TaxID=50990 RepID=A0A4Y7QHL3_9AGAM|nr:hypothetical protein BD410DRAFT_486553 [Rickenella mellea]